MLKVFATWVRDLALLAESVEAVRLPSAQADWRPGAIVRLPFSKRICSNGSAVCSQALMALADTVMVIACSAARNGYRPMNTIDQTTHFLRPVNFDIVANARVMQIGCKRASAGSCCSAPTTAVRSAWWRAPIP